MIKLIRMMIWVLFFGSLNAGVDGNVLFFGIPSHISKTYLLTFSAKACATLDVCYKDMLKKDQALLESQQSCVNYFVKAVASTASQYGYVVENITNFYFQNVMGSEMRDCESGQWFAYVAITHAHDAEHFNNFCQKSDIGVVTSLSINV